MTATTVKVITSAAEMADYAASWNALLEACRCDVPFLLWEWVSSRVAELAEDAEIRILAVYDGGSLVALAPFRLENVNCGGLFSLRVLKPAASGVSDYFDLISGAEKAGEWAAAVWHHIFGPLRPQWDVLELRDVRADSPLLLAFENLARTDGRCHGAATIKRTACPYVALPESWDAYLAGCRRARRYYLLSSRRRLAAAGDLKIHFCDRAEDLPGRMGDLISLNKKSWADRGGSDSFASPELERFHLRAARSFLDRGELLLCSLTLDGEHIASFYGFEHRKRMYYYISAVKRLPRKRVNVLDTLLGFCIEESIKRGCSEFDMLRGGEKYKLRWTPMSRQVVSVRFYNRTVRSAALRVRRGVLDIFRHVNRRAPSPAGFSRP
jgi:CelD/BcsL family acetyltransferase involved in cellulose biosynthesis